MNGSDTLEIDESGLLVQRAGTEAYVGVGSALVGLRNVEAHLVVVIDAEFEFKTVVLDNGTCAFIRDGCPYGQFDGRGRLGIRLRSLIGRTCGKSRHERQQK